MPLEHFIIIARAKLNPPPQPPLCWSRFPALLEAATKRYTEIVAGGGRAAEPEVEEGRREEAGGEEGGKVEEEEEEVKEEEVRRGKSKKGYDAFTSQGTSRGTPGP